MQRLLLVSWLVLRNCRTIMRK
uniref:Uncharacterized protein n=1 Tax=Anguilla anguilla TaxID=7936 RepID=A0A0E9T1D5_ANGAN